MSTPDTTLPDHERRRFPRYYVNAKLTLAIEDESLKESLGLGEPSDISLGGLRVTKLRPAQTSELATGLDCCSGSRRCFVVTCRSGAPRHSGHVWR